MSDTPSPSAGAEAAGHVQQIYETLGGRPVLLPIPRWPGREAEWKGPRYKGWQKLTWEQTQDPAFTLRVPEPPDLEKPDAGGEEVWRPRLYQDLLRSGNIGVLLGEPSQLVEDGRTWHLCSIDIDDSAAVDGFIAVNPGLAFTMQTAGSRGRNFWVWVEGLYPKLHKGICWLATHDHESKTVPGKMIKAGEADPDRPFGEWRATGGQTVLYGVHPSGCRYQTLVRKPPVRIAFDEICWPEGLFLPWRKAEETAAEAEAIAAAKKVLAELIDEHGKPWTKSQKGKIAINQAFFAAFYARKHQIVYSPEEQRFWRYQGDESGLWVKQTEDSIRVELAADIKVISDEEDEEGLINLRTTQLMNAIVGMLRGQMEKWDVFKRPISPKTQRPRALIHLMNGMLDLDDSPPGIRPFAAEYMSRHQLAVSLSEGAQPTRFLAELLGPAVAPEDIELMQKFAGQMLLGVNYAQKLLILTGTAGGGKTTFVNVIEAIIGEKNVGQLRTEHLHERFELFRMIGKSLLVGVDVPGNFMETDGAYVIKGLCGGDLMDAEAKQGNDTFQVRGEFNIIITCNSRLKVRLDGDSAAWRRRLCIVPYEMPAPATPDPHFVRKLVASEASGILNWMIAGAVKLIADLDATGGIRLTAKQKDRVESLLAESDSVRDFVRRGCARATIDHKVTGEQMMQAYVKYCEARGWTGLPGKKVERDLPDALLEIHGATKANDIKIHGDDKAKRGYRGVSLVTLTDEGGADGQLL